MSLTSRRVRTVMPHCLLDVLEDAGLEGAFDEVEFCLPPIQSWSAPLAEFAGW